MRLETVLIEGGVIPAASLSCFDEFNEGLLFVTSRARSDEVASVCLWMDTGLAIFTIHTKVDPPEWLPAVLEIATHELDHPVIRAVGFSTGAMVVDENEQVIIRLVGSVHVDGSSLFAGKEEGETEWQHQPLPEGSELTASLVGIAKSLWGSAWELSNG